MSPETLSAPLLTAPSSVPLCLLTLSLPQAMEETLLDALQALPESSAAHRLDDTPEHA